MKIKENKSEIEIVKEEPKKPEHTRRVYSGMVFPLNGLPFYYCIVREKDYDKTISMEDKEPTLEITREGEAKTISEIKKELKKFEKLNCQNIYVENKKDFYGYIKEINRWKNEEPLDIHFKSTRSVSFESSIMKIKEYVMDKRISFPDESLIRNQLSVFSKNSLKEEEDFYAVKSLCLVIDSFKKQSAKQQEKPPSNNSWW